MTLTQIANRYGTDKGSVKAAGHGYTLVYDLLFSQMRERVSDVCEVGLSRGGPEVADGSADRIVHDVPSARMWHEYFPSARIVGVDISDCSGFAGEWLTFVQADCGEPDQLDRVAALGRQFDIVIDDGSHASFHQQQTLLKLFPMLRPGGFYVIEDLHWQPETYAGGLPAVPRSDILLERYIRTGNFGDTGALPREQWDEIAREVQAAYLFDEDWLASHRRQENARAGVVPDFTTRIDRQHDRRHIRSLFGEMMRRARSAIRGPEHPSRHPAIKLAILRKAAA